MRHEAAMLLSLQQSDSVSMLTAPFSLLHSCCAHSTSAHLPTLTPTRSDKMLQEDILMWGGFAGKETRPQQVQTAWHFAAEFMPNYKAITVGLHLYCLVHTCPRCCCVHRSWPLALYHICAHHLIPP